MICQFVNMVQTEKNQKCLLVTRQNDNHSPRRREFSTQTNIWLLEISKIILESCKIQEARQ